MKANVILYLGACKGLTGLNKKKEHTQTYGKNTEDCDFLVVDLPLISILTVGKSQEPFFKALVSTSVKWCTVFCF